MSTNNNKGIFNRIQNFLLSYDGKTALNFAYSWGAAVVILGALFKLTHLPGANLMLYIGMGTEVLVFLISGFERPDKTYRWESVFPNLEISGKVPCEEGEGATETEADGLLATAKGETVSIPGTSGTSPSVVYVGGGNGASAQGQGMAGASTGATGSASAPSGTTIVGGGVVSGGVINAGGTGSGANGGGIAGGTIGGTVTALPNFPAEEMEDATKDYLEKLKDMTESIGRLNEQMEKLACDPEQMQGVNRHIAGLNAIFELQLRSASKQVESVDKVHEQTEKMAAQIEELNKVYARMLHAMTTNMMNQQSTNL